MLPLHHQCLRQKFHPASYEHVFVDCYCCKYLFMDLFASLLHSEG